MRCLLFCPIGDNLRLWSSRRGGIQLKRYRTILQQHLCQYAKERLGVTEEGTYKGKKYAHVLPSKLRYLNILESIRAELQAYLRLPANKYIKLHEYFHHLTSSQALALNLFYPYFAEGGTAAKALSSALGLNGDMHDGKFEIIPDPKEETNVDAAWSASDGITVLCEVKLSESGFGTADDDKRHRDKLAEVYLPTLKPYVSAALLKEATFFANYQLLRYMWLLSNSKRRFLLLVPRENESLVAPLRKVRDGVDPTVWNRVTVAYIEDCLGRLQDDNSLSPSLRIHAANMQEKYVVKPLI